MTQQAKNHGTAFSDGIRIGSAIYSAYNGGLEGAALPPVIGYEIDTTDTVNLYETQVVAGQLSLEGTQVSYNGIYGLIDLGVARGLTFDTAGADLPNAITYTISGLDIWFHKVTETITLSAGTALPILTKKTYRYIKSIYASADSGDFDILIKTNFFFGLPYFLQTPSDVTVSWNRRLYYAIDVGGTGIQPLEAAPTSLNPYSGTTSILVVGDANTATATTGDPRGGYHINPASTSGTPSASLLITMYCTGFDTLQGSAFAPNALPPSQNSCYGVTQYSTGWQ